MIKYLSKKSTYSFDTNTYVLAVIFGNEDDRVLQYIELDGTINNLTEEDIGVIVDCKFTMFFPCQMNFYKINKAKVTLMFSNIFNNEMDNYIMYGVNTTHTINKPSDLMSEPFVFSVKKDIKNVMIATSGEGTTQPSIIIEKIDSSSAYNVNLKTSFRLDNSLVADNNIGYVDDNRYNSVIAPITGVYIRKINTVDDKITDGTNSFNMTRFIGSCDKGYINGVRYEIVPRSRILTIPFDAYFVQVIKYTNFTVCKFINDFYVPDFVPNRFAYNYAIDNSVCMERNTFPYLNKQKSSRAEFTIVVPGDFDPCDKIKKIFDTIKPVKKYNVKPMMFNKGEYFCELYSYKTLIFVSNKNILPNGNIITYYNSNMILGNLQ